MNTTSMQHTAKNRLVKKWQVKNPFLIFYPPSFCLFFLCLLFAASLFAGTVAPTTADSRFFLKGSAGAGQVLGCNTNGAWYGIESTSGTKYLRNVEGVLDWTDGVAVSPHNLLSATHGDCSLEGTPTTGDLLTCWTNGVWNRLPLLDATPNRYLYTDGTTVNWSPGFLNIVSAQAIQFNDTMTFNSSNASPTTLTLSQDLEINGSPGVICFLGGGFTVPDTTATTAKTMTMNGGNVTAGYPAYWADVNTLTNEQYTSMSRGGTGAGLVNDPGGLPYCGASALAILADGSSGSVLTSGGTNAPAWTAQSSINAGQVDGVSIGSIDEGYLVKMGASTTLAQSAVFYEIGSVGYVAGSLEIQAGTAIPFLIGDNVSVLRLATFDSGPPVRFRNPDATFSNLGLGALSVGQTYAATAAPTNGAIFEGDVGIGTTPNSKLDVYGASSATSLRIGNNAGTGDTTLDFYGKNGVAIPIYANVGTEITGGTPGDERGNLYFSTITSGALSKKVTILNTGNVGLGTTAPSQILSLGGDSARVIYMERESSGAGNNLQIKNGGGQVATADLAGGDLQIGSGTSTGTGQSAINFYTAAAIVTGKVITISATPSAAGSGYAADETLTLTAGSADCSVNVDTVDEFGAVTALSLVDGGTSGYYVQSGNETTGGSGSGCQVNITDVESIADNAIALRAAINGAGNLGIGITAATDATTKLWVMGADNSTAATIKINASQANVTAADTFIDFRSTTGSEGSIAGTASAGVIAYNTFTGSHYTHIAATNELFLFALLEIADGKLTPANWPKITVSPGAQYKAKEQLPDEIKITKQTNGILVTNLVPASREITITNPPVELQASPKDHLFTTRLCQTKASKRAIGAWGGRDREGRDLVLSLGTGRLWLSNTGTNLDTGDLLISSAIPGHAEKQPDDLVRNSTVGKITEPVTWSKGETNRLVNVVYLGG